MVVQDDARERQLIELFGLERIEGAGRGDTDAALALESGKISFELKSSTYDSVTTARDVGPLHLEKWRRKHWLFGFYEADGKTLKYCLYGSPGAMAKWIDEQEEYLQLDVALARVAPSLLTLESLFDAAGKKEVYTLEDAIRIYKRPKTASSLTGKEVKALADVAGGYTPNRMLEILRRRCQYLIERGSTRNNPHIPGKYFNGWERITEHHATRLREMVAQALEDEAKELQKAAQAVQESARKIDKAT